MSTDAKQESNSETISGTVESIVYRNDETGYTVCTLKTVTRVAGSRLHEEKVKVVGS